MDISMPVLDGIAATVQLKASPPLASIPVIGFTTYKIDGLHASAATAAGMRELLPKHSGFRDLVAALRAAVDKG